MYFYFYNKKRRNVYFFNEYNEYNEYDLFVIINNYNYLMNKYVSLD